MKSTMPKSSTASPPPANHAGSSLLTPGVEHQGESSLSAQVTFANRFLEDAVINKSVGSSIAIEMTSVLESLRKALGKNSGQQDHDYLYPHARPLERGLNLRNLPMPPVELAFVCLRMAKGIDGLSNLSSDTQANLVVQKTPEFDSSGIMRQTPSHPSMSIFSRSIHPAKPVILTLLW